MFVTPSSESRRNLFCLQFFNSEINLENNNKMTVYHDEVEIEDFEYDEDEDLYTYPCVS